MMIRRNHRERGGTSLVEFTLVGIPMIFLLISTFEISRGMWIYHTLAFGVKEGTRYASVHGQTCSIAPNNCTVTVAQVAQQIENFTGGLLPGQLTLTLTTTGTSKTCTITNCLLDNSTWPPAPDNAPGNDIQISGRYPFQSAISMFWPGAGPSVGVATVNFGASAREGMHN